MRALAHHDGIGEQIELVDQVVGEQPSDEDTAAGHQQVAVVPGLHNTHSRGDVAAQHGRARPPRGGEAGRNQVLGLPFSAAAIALPGSIIVAHEPARIS